MISSDKLSSSSGRWTNSIALDVGKNDGVGKRLSKLPKLTLLNPSLRGGREYPLDDRRYADFPDFDEDEPPFLNLTY